MPDKDQQKKGSRRLDGYVLVILGLLLWVVGGQFNNKPLVAHNKLLVATSGVTMPELSKAVIFVISHTRAGTQGIIINRPGKKGAAGDGGPVEKHKPFALHTLDVMLTQSKVLKDAGIAVLDDPKAIAKLKAARARPAWHVIVNGYAGWGSGQMEQEVADGAWRIVEFDRAAVTATPPAKLWEAAKKFPQIQLTH